VPKKVQAWAAELVGTYAFVTIIVASVIVSTGGLADYGLLGIATAHGVALAAMVSTFAALSGSHFNPAVTLSSWIGRKLSGSDAIGYVVAQIAGGLAAGLTLRVVFAESAWRPSNLGTPGLTVSSGKGLFLEALFTFFLLLSIWGTGFDERGAKVGGIAIGFTLFGLLLIDGPLTGAGLNQARYLASAVVSGHVDDWWVYIVGPAIGGLAAGILYPTVFWGGWPWARSGGPERKR
jgi:MIP family channel proteins